MNAELTFYYGSMGCGKTRELLKVSHSKKEDGFGVAIMKPEVDKKGGKYLVSRDESEQKVDFLIKSKDNIYLEISKYLVNHNLNFVLVDEAQFLEPHHIDELSDVVDILGISVICYGLRSDFKTMAFPGSLRLFEVSDVMEELITICRCGKRAKFNGRIVNGEFTSNGEQVAIDGENHVEYESLCGKCYLEKVLGITSLDE